METSGQGFGIANFVMAHYYSRGFFMVDSFNSLSHFHFHLIFISLSSSCSFHGPGLSYKPRLAGVLCVERLKRSKTSFLSLLFLLNFKCRSRGTQHFTGTESNEATSEIGFPVWPTGRTCNSIFGSLMRHGAKPRTPHTDIAAICFFVHHSIWNSV